MELLFILGNGFDINLGMKTGYQDFYDFYKEVKNEDPEIVAMKKSIETGRYTTWSDLEAGLGKYTMQLTDSIVFIRFIIPGRSLAETVATRAVGPASQKRPLRLLALDGAE